MKRVRSKFWSGLLASALTVSAAQATERYFTYSYEPETMPAGAMEFEQWVTLRTQRTRAVGQDNFNRWELREEFEYGVNDNYTVALYLNTSAESFRHPATGSGDSKFEFTGISLENRYMIWNPADHAVGLAFYLEPRFSGEEAEVEERIILGQRHGHWKWALNLAHATEWEDNLHRTAGELEAVLGLARDLHKHWAAGLEFRNLSVIPRYKQWAYTVLFLGPVVSYRRENWWVSLTVLPQIYGKNFQVNSDGDPHLVLDEQERLNVRLILGFSF